jgi:hypothetical protein
MLVRIVTMMIIRAAALLILFVCLQLHSAAGQSKLILKHKRKGNKVKTIDLDRDFEIHTNDTAYFTRIIGFTDSTILIPIKKRTGKDSIYIRKSAYTKYSKSTFFQIGEPRIVITVDSTVIPLYRADTTVIRFSEVLMMKKNWFKSRRWIEPFAWLIPCSVLGVVVLPVAAIDDGSRGVRDWAIAEAVMLGIALPPIFIGSRKTKYDLIKKWTLETR